MLDTIGRLSILVVGDVMLDRYISGEATRVSPEAPVPIVHVQSEYCRPGGAANVAHNLSVLGVRTELIGAYGEDADAAVLRALLRGTALHHGSVRGVPTVVKTRVVVGTHQVCRFDREAPRESYAPGPLLGLEPAVQGVDAVIVSDYGKGFVTQGLLRRLVEICHRRDTLLVVDPKPSSRLDLSGVSLMTPNWVEACDIARLPHGTRVEEVAARIHDLYAPVHLVITLGAAGMALCSKGVVDTVLPTQAKQVFDVTGAGDTVVAILAAGLASGLGVLQAAILANKAAGIVVSKFGTAVATPAELLE